MNRPLRLQAAKSILASLVLCLVFSAGFAQTKDTTPAAPVKAPLPQDQPAVPKGQSSAPITADQKTAVLNRINDIIETNAFVPGVDFTKWPSFLAAERSDIDKATTNRDFSMAVNKALHKFGFSHIVLITPEAAQSRISEKSVGIGVLLQAEPDGMRVLNVFPGSPAETAGLATGDLIVEGNGKKPDTPLDLQGDEGTDLTVKVKHVNGKLQNYTLTRRKYNNVRPETLTWINKDTAVLRVYTFDISYSRENVEKLVKQVEDANGKNIILDLRSNPGGSILNLIHLMGLLLPPSSPLGTFITRMTVNHYVQDEKGKPTDLAAIARWSKSGKLLTKSEEVPYFKGHVAVLVNGGSGSAAEIAAAALRDDADAPIVGSKSAGAVLVSVMNQVPEGFMLQYPITDYVTVNGIRLEGTGVAPLIETPAIVKYDAPDEAVEKAALLLDRADLRDERDSTSPIH